jgi:hypothetical protein
MKKDEQIRALQNSNSSMTSQNGRLQDDNQSLKNEKNEMKNERDQARSESAKPLADFTKLIKEVESKIDLNAEVVNRFAEFLLFFKIA